MTRPGAGVEDGVSANGHADDADSIINQALFEHLSRWQRIEQTAESGPKVVMFVRKAIVQALAASALAAAVMTGCTATLTTTSARTRLLYSHEVVLVESPPPDIYDSPWVTYRGQPAYLVGTRWYYSVEGRWVYFVQEPPVLRRYRDTSAYSRVHPRATRPRYVAPQRRYVVPPSETRRRRYD
jgi:hypothetical protein